jgi:CxxC motif-containing protein (DUF1111 family)
MGCADCHTPSLPTREGGKARVFSDLLLHDLGPDLAGDAEPQALAREWRTAPLVGLGSVTSGYLHDGRAPTLEAAILAHGGEAERARQRYRAASRADRATLLSYLQRL